MGATLISEDYKKLNEELHKTNLAYGTSGHRWADEVVETAARTKSESILDYGCGKQTLKDALPEVQGYDPCIKGLEKKPERADLVVCTDVLEHIEPAHLTAVLDDIYLIAEKAVFLTVATGPALKTLADGRNAHLIQKPASWWLPKLERRWKRRFFHDVGGEFLFIGLADGLQFPRGTSHNSSELDTPQ